MTEDSAKVVAPATGGQIARGAAWLMLFKGLDKGLGLLSTLLLARLLVPADFGLVAMAMSVVAFTQLMSAFGFDTALIQRQDAGREHYDTAWTFNVIFGAAMAVLLAVLAKPMSSFYRDDRLTAVLLLLAVSTLVAGLENIGTVAFRKQLDFRSEFKFLLGKRFASFAVTVALALTLRSYWALVVGTVVSRVLAVAISFVLHPFRPRLSLAASRELMHFSKWIFLSGVISFFSWRSIDFILGRTIGAHGLGLYSVSFEIATLPSTELIAPLNRAVYPAYTKLANDPQQLESRFLQVFGVICLLGVPVCAGLFAAAEPAVRVLLGAQWLEAVPLVRIFTLCGLIGALQSNLYLVVVALGKPQANTVLSGVVLVLCLPLLVWASLKHGVYGAALAVGMQGLVGLIGILWVFGRITGIRLRSLLAVFWRPALVSLAMAGVMAWADPQLRAVGLGAALSLLLALCLCGAATYVAGLALLWRLCGCPPGAEQTVFAWIGRRLNVLRRRTA